MALPSNTQAPDFTLKYKHAEGLEDVTLSNNYGNAQTVLLFFPLAFTGVCMNEMCTIRDTLGEYETLGATVYGISVDSPFTQEVMSKQENINFKLLSDFNREVSKSYDVLYDVFLPGKLGFNGVSKRSAFVINQGGQITYSWSSDDPANLPPFDEILSALG
jgi:peroxiredoxin